MQRAGNDGRGLGCDTQLHAGRHRLAVGPAVGSAGGGTGQMASNARMAGAPASCAVNSSSKQQSLWRHQPPADGGGWFQSGASGAATAADDAGGRGSSASASSPHPVADFHEDVADGLGRRLHSRRGSCRSAPRARCGFDVHLLLAGRGCSGCRRQRLEVVVLGPNRQPPAIRSSWRGQICTAFCRCRRCCGCGRRLDRCRHPGTPLAQWVATTRTRLCCCRALGLLTCRSLVRGRIHNRVMVTPIRMGGSAQRNSTPRHQDRTLPPRDRAHRSTNYTFAAGGVAGAATCACSARRAVLAFRDESA